jgi:hypothetical protein
MSPAPAAIWRQIVAGYPPDYFDVPNQHLLAALCGHAARADLIAHEIAGLDPRDPQQFRRLARLSIIASRETRMLTMCLTKLRLLPTKTQAETAAAAATASARARPLP